VFVPGKLFQPSLSVCRKARSLPLSYLSKSLLTRIGSDVNCKTLDKGGKACLGQTLQLIPKISKLRQYKVLTFANGAIALKL
jgi:hypothetical protein